MLIFRTADVAAGYLYSESKYFANFRLHKKDFKI